MHGKSEGLASTPLPLERRPIRRAELTGVRAPEDRGAPRCEMCGAVVIASHCKRICLRCGFMAGCSDTI